MTQAPLARPIPVITEMNDYFWRGGAGGELHIQRCQSCQTYAHPYVGRCRHCGGKAMEPEAVSGLASVVGFTINHQPWFPHVPVPYVVAIVTIDEQDDIYLVTNLVNCPVESVSIGMKVRVLFEQYGETFVPIFEPV